MRELSEKYGGYEGSRRTEAEAKEVLAEVHLMTLGGVKNGEREFFAAEITEIPWQPGYYLINTAYYSSHVGKFGESIRGTQDSIPPALIRIFPELGGEIFFVAEVGLDRWHKPAEVGFTPDPGRKWIIEYVGDNNLRRWTLPAVQDLATSQITALLALRSELESAEYDRGLALKIGGVEFGSPDLFCWFEEKAVPELIRRAEGVPLDQSCQATSWLLANFCKEDSRMVGWLEGVVKALRPGHGIADSPAADFADRQPVTGNPDEWEWLSAIPEHRKKITNWESPEGMMFCIPDGQDRLNRDSRETIPVRKIPGIGGYYRDREDGRTDLFLRRGSRELGDKGWMWVLIDPAQELVECRVVAALDPLNNYSGLREFFSPLFARVSRAYATAKGKEIASDGLYSDAIIEALS